MTSEKPRGGRPPQPIGLTKDADVKFRTRAALKEALFERAGDGQVSGVLEALIAWWLREPDARLPERPPLPKTKQDVA